MDKAQLYSRPEAAEKLRLSLRMLDELITTREIASLRVGKRRLISEKSLSEFIKKREAEEA
jgi:excisionase family DNA binding protein